MSTSLRHRTVARFGIVSGFVLLGAVGLSSSACEHGAAQKVLLEDAKPGLERQAPRYVVQGLEPQLALVPTVTDVPAVSEPPVTGDGPVVLGTMSCGHDPVKDTYVTKPEHAAQAQALLNRMNADQRLIQITGQDKPNYSDTNRWRDIQQSRDDYKLGIRGYQWRDGPHGINLEAGLENIECHGDDCVKEDFRKTKFGSGENAQRGNFSTSFPTSVGQGATWDVNLMTTLGEAMGDETQASGHNVLLTPCMNLLRNPLWGRAQETFGEDVFLLGRMASAQTWGLQEHVTGCVKHYLANNIELRRMYIDVELDERSIREVYGRHFEMVVREGGIGCVMASYNLVNGKKSTQNKHILTQVLKRDYGFRGFILTDWWAMPSSSNGQGDQNTVSDSTRVALQAIYAGLDVEVPWAVNYYTLKNQLETGQLPWTVVDQAVLRVLEQKLRFGTAMLGDPWGPTPVESGYDPSIGSITKTEEAGHTAIAAKVAEEGMVLLKNDGAVLPIPQTVTKVAIIAPYIDYWVNTDSPKDKTFDFAVNIGLGDRGSSRVRPDPLLIRGPQQGLEEARPGTDVKVYRSAAEVLAAGDREFVVVIVGLTAGDEGEEYTGAADRDSLTLPSHWDATESDAVRAAWRSASPQNQEAARPKTLDQNKLIIDALATGIPTAVVIEAGGAVDDTEQYPWLDMAPAIVMAWYPGMRGGEALGNLLMGNSNFAGRLPVTWPYDISQFPNFTLGEQVPNPQEYHVGYRYFDWKEEVPRFYFGHGLSYSTFSIDRIYTQCGDVQPDTLVQLEVDVTNQGPFAGDEVIQVYASYQASTVERSKKELKGFARVTLQNGESKRVTIPVKVEDMRYWDDENQLWVIEGGPLDLWVGTSSAPDKLMHHTTVNVAEGSFP